MKDFHISFAQIILAISNELKQTTGIGGKNLIQGLEWDRLKQTAMKEGQPSDRVIVSSNL